ncbi:MAG: NAD(P)-dependent oxidoreductase, partial [Gammaproteobacteria bacterium]
MPERVLIFGATGGTGKHLVRQALDRGMHVTAFVRDPTKLDIQDKNLQVALGDMLDAESVDRAMAEGFDAVLCAAGIYQREYKTDLSDGTKNILAAMKAHGVRRLLVVSSIGAGDSKGQGAWWVKAYYRYMLK